MVTVLPIIVEAVLIDTGKDTITRPSFSLALCSLVSSTSFLLSFSSAYMKETPLPLALHDHETLLFSLTRHVGERRSSVAMSLSECSEEVGEMGGVCGGETEGVRGPGTEEKLQEKGAGQRGVSEDSREEVQGGTSVDSGGEVQGGTSEDSGGLQGGMLADSGEEVQEGMSEDSGGIQGGMSVDSGGEVQGSTSEDSGGIQGGTSVDSGGEVQGGTSEDSEGIQGETSVDSGGKVKGGTSEDSRGIQEQTSVASGEEVEGSTTTDSRGVVQGGLSEDLKTELQEGTSEDS